MSLQFTSSLFATVWVKTSFEGVHRWKDAPEEVSHLRHWHAHTFHVQAARQVMKLDRETEFFLFKKEVDDWLNAHYAGQHFEDSCEHIAAKMIAHLNLCSCDVSEDDQRGAFLQVI